MEETILYVYYGQDGTKYHTPNEMLAFNRAEAHGTVDLYIERFVKGVQVEQKPKIS